MFSLNTVSQLLQYPFLQESICNWKVPLNQLQEPFISLKKGLLPVKVPFEIFLIENLVDQPLL
jgi:hypothetical protein